MGRSKQKKSKENREREKVHPSVVGPDLFLLLQGQLFGESNPKNVSLILCGESHNDAIDITRMSPPGKFEPTEGWIPLFDTSSSPSFPSDNENNPHEITRSALSNVLCVMSPEWPVLGSEFRKLTPEEIGLRFLYPITGKRKNPWLTLEDAKKLAADFVESYAIEESMFGQNLLLLWIVPNAEDHYRRQRNRQRRSGAEEGQAFLLEIESDRVVMEYYNTLDEHEEDDDSDSSHAPQDTFEDWVFFSSDSYHQQPPMQQRNREFLPELVAHWMDEIMRVENNDNAIDIHDNLDDDETLATIDVSDDDSDDDISLRERTTTRTQMIGRYAIFEYGDLDSEAHDLSKRRLGYMTDADVAETEYDAVVELRKRRLKQNHSIWTFDDWFDHVKNQTEKNPDNENLSLHLVLEASVPPWEVELHRPPITNGDMDSTNNSKAEDFRLHPASECIRCLSEDSEISTEDEIDPSNDGIGSYIDFVYRKMMTKAVGNPEATENRNTENGPVEQKENSNVSNSSFEEENESENTVLQPPMIPERNGWFHCVDSRDLGCEGACHAESLKQGWYDLLRGEEKQLVTDPNYVPSDYCPVDSGRSCMRFLPEPMMNPEWTEIKQMKSEGIILPKENDGNDEDAPPDADKNALELTFPSFELFFGTNTDNLYYSPHVKLAYSPFLATCVKSLDNWADFFSNLFLGGTVADALALLSLNDEVGRGNVHVRSPILQHWDFETNSYVWKERNEAEDYITCPFFPFIFHLVARGSSPPRTWSSQLFHNMYSFPEDQETKSGRRNVALSIRSWILNSIERNMRNPKSSDDPECGGEWFVAFLRAVHREIYDDIDVSDPSVLIQKNYMKSLTGKKKFVKHNIGKIKIPTAKDAFQEILERFREKDNIQPSETLVTSRVEILAKLLIDIWMSNLFDFSLLLKIVNICSKEKRDNVVIVCYVGSAHAKVVRDFFTCELGFKRKAFVGKFNWGDDEPVLLNLPSKLWNLSELFH